MNIRDYLFKEKQTLSFWGHRKCEKYRRYVSTPSAMAFPSSVLVKITGDLFQRGSATGIRTILKRSTKWTNYGLKKTVFYQHLYTIMNHVNSCQNIDSPNIYRSRSPKLNYVVEFHPSNCRDPWNQALFAYRFPATFVSCLNPHVDGFKKRFC